MKGPNFGMMVLSRSENRYTANDCDVGGLGGSG